MIGCPSTPIIISIFRCQWVRSIKSSYHLALLIFLPLLTRIFAMPAKRSIADRFLDLEAEVDDAGEEVESEHEDGGLSESHAYSSCSSPYADYRLNLDDFVVSDDEHDPIDHHLRVPSPIHSETAEDLVEKARAIDRRASRRRYRDGQSAGVASSSGGASSGTPNNVARDSTSLVRITMNAIADTEVRGFEVYSFKVPVRVIFKIQRTPLIFQ
jgi:hypothetical protein